MRNRRASAPRREPALLSPTAQRLSDAATKAEVAASVRRQIAFIELHGTASEIARMNRGISAIARLIQVARASDHPNDDSEMKVEAELFCIEEIISASRSFDLRAANQILRDFASVLGETHVAARAILFAISARNRDARLDLIQAGAFEASMSESERTQYRGLTSGNRS